MLFYIIKHFCKLVNTFLQFLQQLRYVVNESFGLFPAKAGVGNGFSEDMLLGLTSTVLKVALDHKPLDELSYVGRITAAVKYLLGNSDLLKILFARVCMVCINNNRRILKSALFV